MTHSKNSVSPPGQEGFTIATAVMNRSENLTKAIPSWIRSAATEIVIVDYGSEDPLEAVIRESGIQDSRIRVLRVENVQRWHLSAAFNLALSQIMGGFILKVDADIELNKANVDDLPVRRDTFVTGNWKSDNPSQVHTNGSLFCHVDHLKVIGGWDPRIRTYGWEDSDLYERLVALGLSQAFFPPGFLHHLEHSDQERLNLGFTHSDTQRLLQASTQANRFASESDFPWKGPIAPAELSLLEENPEQFIWPRLSATERAFLNVTSLLDELSRPEVVPNVPGEISPQGMRRRLRSMIRAARRPKAPVDKTVGPNPKHLVVRVEHGLGNRMRALASGFQLAQRFGAKLTVAWIPDHHCEARINDLFHWEGQVIDSQDQLECLLGTEDFKEFDWTVSMTDEAEAFSGTSERPLYIRSSKSFGMHDSQSWRIANRFLQQLVPKEPVQNLMKSFPHDFAVGVHVRQVGGFSFEHLPHESVHNWGFEGQEKIDKARQSVKTEEFIGLIDYLYATTGLAEEKSVFVAADNFESKRFIVAHLGGNARFLDSDPESRGVESIQQALAELYALASCRFFVGSVYSAYSEVAQRLALKSQVFRAIGNEGS